MTHIEKLANNKIGFTFIYDDMITRKTFEFVSFFYFIEEKNPSSDIILKIFFSDNLLLQHLFYVTHRKYF